VGKVQGTVFSANIKGSFSLSERKSIQGLYPKCLGICEETLVKIVWRDHDRVHVVAHDIRKYRHGDYSPKFHECMY